MLFEDAGWWRHYPLALTRPVFELRVGVTSLGRRLLAQMAARKYTRASLLCREYLAAVTRRAFPTLAVNEMPLDGDLLFLNGATLFFKGELERLLKQLETTPVLHSGGRLVAARLPAAEGKRLLKWLSLGLETVGGVPGCPRELRGQPTKEPVRFMDRPWDLIHQNEPTLMDDFSITSSGFSRAGAGARAGGAMRGAAPTLPALSPGAHLVKKNRILARPGARVMTGAVLDASSGPIILGENARIMPNAVVMGPAYIGPNSVIKIGAKIYGGTSIGPVCKVGGEVEGSILQGYSNKQHEGFLGHSYLGEWTNLGAGTDTSDLKNNYGTVRVGRRRGSSTRGSASSGSAWAIMRSAASARCSIPARWWAFPPTSSGRAIRRSRSPRSAGAAVTGWKGTRSRRR